MTSMLGNYTFRVLHDVLEKVSHGIDGGDVNEIILTAYHYLTSNLLMEMHCSCVIYHAMPCSMFKCRG